MNDDYLSTIYGGADEIDPRLAAAGELLAKVAEDEGVDLDEYSDDEITEMLGSIMDEGDAGSDDHEGGHEGFEGGEDKTSGLTVADVAVELSKQAAAEGIDLSQLSREQYHQAYNYVHEQLTNPDFQQAKVAMEEKVAEADMLGRVMAHSFDDELRKVAETKMMFGKKITEIAGGHGGKTVAGGGGPSAAERVKGEVGERVKSLASKVKGLSGKQKAMLAGAAGLTAAAGAGGAYAYKKHKEKKSFDEAVVDRARDILIANGVDPDTGTKVAGDLDEAALWLLRENGYDV